MHNQYTHWRNGDLKLKVGHLKEAIEEYNEALEIIEMKKGPDSASAAKIMANIALAQRCMGNKSLAEGYYHHAFNILSQKYGTNHPDTVTVAKALSTVMDTPKPRKYIEPRTKESLQEAFVRFSKISKEVTIKQWVDGIDSAFRKAFSDFDDLESVEKEHFFKIVNKFLKADTQTYEIANLKSFKKHVEKAAYDVAMELV